MTAEEEARFARSQGYIVCDYRVPRLGDSYLFGKEVKTAYHSLYTTPRTIVTESFALLRERRSALSEFKLNDIVREREDARTSVGLGGLWRIIQIPTEKPDAGSVKLESVNGAARVWTRLERLELVASTVQEHSGYDETQEENDFDPADPTFDPMDPVSLKVLFSDTHEAVQWYAGDTKATNPKDAIGSSKLPLHLWPETATLYGCLGLLDGALKYGRGNWREAGVRASIYVDALRRHVAAWAEGEDVDAIENGGSGLPHLAHALACLAIIVDAQAAGKLVDDRNFPGGYRGLVEELTPHVGRLKEKHAHRDPKHWTIADALQGEVQDGPV